MTKQWQKIQTAVTYTKARRPEDDQLLTHLVSAHVKANYQQADTVPDRPLWEKRKTAKLTRPNPDQPKRKYTMASRVDLEYADAHALPEAA